MSDPPVLEVVPAALEAVLATIRSASRAALDPAIDEALTLSRYPVAAPIVPLAEALSPAQRATMVALAGRSGLDDRGLTMRAVPGPVQVRRRWLGLDPPSALERLVRAPGGTVPLWYAWRKQPRLPGSRERFSLVPRPLDRFEIETELWLFPHACYGLEPHPSAIYELCLGLGEDGARWAEAMVRKLLGSVRTTQAITPEAGSDLQITLSAACEPGFDTFEAPAVVPRNPVLLCLFTAIADGGGVLDEAWDELIDFGHEHLWRILAAVPTARHDAIVVRGFRREPTALALDAGLALLEHLPSAPLASQIAQRLEDPTLGERQRRRKIDRWERTWNALEGKLGPEIWRPLRLASPPAEPAIEASASPLTHPPTPSLDGPLRRAGASHDGSDSPGRSPLADEADFAALSREDRLAIGDRIATELGRSFRAGAELVGIAGHITVKHVPSGVELVVFPGGSFEMGLTEADVAMFGRYFPCGPQDKWAGWLEREAAEARPVRTVRVSPFAFGRNVLTLGQLAKLGRPRDEGDTVAARGAAALVRGFGFRLPSEAEWEYVAREGRAATFVRGAAATWFDGADLRTETLGGARDLGFCEWVADRWHKTYAGAPRTSAAWTAGEGELVCRGFIAGVPEHQNQIALALAAMRSGAHFVEGNQFLRVALSPNAKGVWTFPQDR